MSIWSFNGWRRGLLLLPVMAVLLAGCGFEPVHKRGVAGEERFALRALSLPATPAGDQLKRLLAPYLSENAEADYALEIALETGQTGLLLDREGTALRLRVTSQAQLTLLSDAATSSASKTLTVAQEFTRLDDDMVNLATREYLEELNVISLSDAIIQYLRGIEDGWR